MATLRVDLDRDTLERLARQAVRERRPLAMQAEVVLRDHAGPTATSASPTPGPNQEQTPPPSESPTHGTA
jgi:hypothetical protein